MTEKRMPNLLIESNTNSTFQHIIGVVSGKGGVGKSFVTSMLANSMVRKGYRVGILDADITGPSIPKYFGLRGQATGDENGKIIPFETDNGIKVISINLLLPKQDDAVIWRGPVINGVVKQFYQDVIWGDLDYLFIDMPPGTGDVPLTVFQSIPIDGIVVATTPSDLVEIIVKKAIHMAKMMGKKIFGIVENMSYLECPDCKKRIEVFGTSHVDKISKDEKIDIACRVPIDPKISQHTEQGKISQLEIKGLEPIILQLEHLNHEN